MAILNLVILNAILAHPTDQVSDLYLIQVKMKALLVERDQKIRQDLEKWTS
jgi:hypothetical protein